jgi:MFS family permease
MAPQGIGAACVMRFSGRLTDRVGPRRVVPVGIIVMAVATIPFGFVTTGTNEGLLGAALFVRGLGLGLSMMPMMAAAYFDLSHAAIPRASTTLNIVRQIGGSVATALFAVVLERRIVHNFGSHVTSGNTTALLSSTAKLPAPVADKIGHAFSYTFWWSVFTILLAFVPTLLLPNHGARAQPPAGTGDGDDAPAAPMPALME